MKIKHIVFLAASVICATAGMTGAASARDFPNWYVGLSGQYSFKPDTDLNNNAVTHDDGLGFSAALGYRPPAFHYMRLEAEVSHYSHDNDTISIAGVQGALTGKTQATTYMANMMFDLHNESRWTPYFGGGVGMAKVGFEGAGIDNSDFVFAYQLRTGLAYSPYTMPNLDVYLGYRFIGLGDASFQGNRLDDNYYHNAELGARFNF